MHYTEKHSDLIMCDIDEMRKSSPPKDDPSITMIYIFLYNFLIYNRYIILIQMKSVINVSDIF